MSFFNEIGEKKWFIFKCAKIAFSFNSTFASSIRWAQIHWFAHRDTYVLGRIRAIQVKYEFELRITYKQYETTICECRCVELCLSSVSITICLKCVRGGGFGGGKEIETNWQKSIQKTLIFLNSQLHSKLRTVTWFPSHLIHHHMLIASHIAWNHVVVVVNAKIWTSMKTPAKFILSN